MPHYPRWTVEEEQTLKANFPKLSLNSCTGPVTQTSLLFLFHNKTWDSIKWKARQLGLKREFKKVYSPLKLSDFDRGYLAGLLDGEGCISLIRNKRKGGYERYYQYVSIANTDLAVLKWVETVTGFGRVRRLNQLPFTPLRKEHNQKPWTWTKAYTWQASSCAEVYTLLKNIGQVLKIKKEQAQLILEFLDIESQKPHAHSIRNPETGFFVRRIPIFHTQKQTEIFKRIRELNAGFRKGKTRKKL